MLPLLLATAEVIVLVLTRLHEWDLRGGILGWVDADPGVLRGLFIAGSVLSVAGVLICRWARRSGLALATVPFVLLALTDTFVWAWLMALVFVAVIVGVDRWRTALLPWALAVAVSVVYCLTGVRALILDGPVQINFRRNGFPGVPDASTDWNLLITYLGSYLLLVTAPVAIAIAIGLLHSARAARREAAASERRAFEVESAATERARLARDLHDVVAHHLSLVAVRAESAPFTHPGIGAEAREVLTAIAADARSALDELRQVLKVLRHDPGDEPARAPQPGAADIAALLRDAADSGQRVTVSGGGLDGVPAAVGYVLYRAVQEALTNARRHAPSAPVALTIDRTGQSLTLRASNPVPPGETLGVDGRGLIGMRERVTALGGTVSAGIDYDVFSLTVQVPLEAADPGPGSAVIPDSGDSLDNDGPNDGSVDGDARDTDGHETDGGDQ